MTGGVEALAARFGLAASSVEPLSELLLALAEPASPTAVRDPRAAIDVHLADALVALELEVVRSATALADIGSGAGLPGLALAAALPSCRVFLVESNARKSAWAAATAARSGLDNVEAVTARAEEWAAGREACDVITARALAALPVVCEYAAPLLRPPAGEHAGGTLVAWKGAVDVAEVADGAYAASQLGLGAPIVHAVTPYEGSERRTLWTFTKQAPTPERFPRRAGLAAKRPLSATKA